MRGGKKIRDLFVMVDLGMTEREGTIAFKW